MISQPPKKIKSEPRCEHKGVYMKTFLIVFWVVETSRLNGFGNPGKVRSKRLEFDTKTFFGEFYILKC